jgi:hypothetical protein
MDKQAKVEELLNKMHAGKLTLDQAYSNARHFAVGVEFAEAYKDYLAALDEYMREHDDTRSHIGRM